MSGGNQCPASQLWHDFDEKEREAVRVVAENVPGSKAVKEHLILMEPLYHSHSKGEGLGKVSIASSAKRMAFWRSISR
jgi:hypothetical protein